jgi:integrase
MSVATPTSTRGSRAGADEPPVAASAVVVDHGGPPRHPHRVTIIRLARAKETYEIRWRENVRSEDGTVVRERRAEPGGHSKAAAYAKAEKVWRNLDRSGGYHGAPPRPRNEPAARAAKTLQQIGELWLAQHTGKPGTVEGYQSAMNTCIWPELTWTEARRGQQVTRRIHLGVMAAEEVTPADVNHWINALSQKPDARRKDAAVPVSSSTVKANLRILTACLNWGVAHGYLDKNPAAHPSVSVTVHGARKPEWFRTPEDFWAALAPIDEHWNHALHNALVACAYLGLRVKELAALRPDDVDLAHHRVHIRHNFDARHRASTVKSEQSEAWMRLHPEAEQAIKDELAVRVPRGREDLQIFRGPRGGILGSTLLNDALTHGCTKAGVGYRVTIHGLRHSIANWLKTAGVPTPDIQATLRHADPRTTAAYLHTSAEERTQAINQLPGRPTNA